MSPFHSHYLVMQFIVAFNLDGEMSVGYAGLAVKPGRATDLDLYIPVRLNIRPQHIANL